MSASFFLFLFLLVPHFLSFVGDVLTVECVERLIRTNNMYQWTEDNQKRILYPSESESACSGELHVRACVLP